MKTKMKSLTNNQSAMLPRFKKWKLEIIKIRPS